MTTTNKLLLVLAAAAAVFALGRCSAGSGAPGSSDGDASAAAEPAEDASTIWTCPMHPQIRLPEFGPCPICGMDLVPQGDESDDAPRRMTLSPEAKRLAAVETAPVRRKTVTRPVRMVGKVDYDETAVRTISARVPGRLDRLYVDYTGIPVREGEHLVELYSPDLLTAQEELLSAKQRLEDAAGDSEFLAKSNRRAYRSAREKLLLWGLSETQVDAIEERGTVEDWLTIRSPNSGVVIEKRLDEGAYVDTGTPIYRIADLTQLWVRLDAYEQDLSWLRYGQDVVLEIEALPGEVLEGTIAFIDPYIHEHTRTAKVRVNVANPGGRLKPGMFVSAVVLSRLGAGGVVQGPDLAGKWICPMHPEVVEDGPGQCDVCGMNLVPAEELGLTGEVPEGAEPPLVVPASAVLVTGERAVVYVEVPGAERPTYEGREILLGPRAGEEYLVRAGLGEGERVVVNGAFRIDSAMQIRAKPSMMSMPGEAERARGPSATLFREALANVLDEYLALQTALAGDDAAAARDALQRLCTALDEPPAAGLPVDARLSWKDESGTMRAALERASSAEDLAGIREAFESLSGALLVVVDEIGTAGTRTLHEAWCPMAFDGRGAAWLQEGETIANPYFGASMLRCGELRESFVPVEPSRKPASGASATGGEGEHDDHAGHSGQDDHGAHSGTGEPDGEAASETTQDADADADAEEDTEEDAGAPPADEPREEDAAVLRAYLKLQEALAGDDAAGARDAAGALLSAARTAASAHDASSDAARAHSALAKALSAADARADLASLRVAFEAVTAAVLALESAVGNPLAESLVLVHCPMAFDFEGADWLQRPGENANPYFGAEMLRCGSVRRELEGR